MAANDIDVLLWILVRDLNVKFLRNLPSCVIPSFKLKVRPHSKNLGLFFLSLSCIYDRTVVVIHVFDTLIVFEIPDFNVRL